MSFHKGNGGKVTFGVTPYDPQVTHWQFRKKARLKESTNSSSAGQAGYTPTVKEGTGTFKFFWDDLNTPESASLLEGATGTAKFYLGDSGKAYTVPLIVEEIGFDCDNVEGLVECDVSFKINGAVTGPA